MAEFSEAVAAEIINRPLTRAEQAAVDAFALRGDGPSEPLGLFNLPKPPTYQLRMGEGNYQSFDSIVDLAKVLNDAGVEGPLIPDVVGGNNFVSVTCSALENCISLFVGSNPLDFERKITMREASEIELYILKYHNLQKDLINSMSADAWKRVAPNLGSKI